MIEAESVFLSGRVRTCDAKNSIVQALAVFDGKILTAGTDDEAKRFIAASTKVIDLKGRAVIPGFHDAHCHVLSFGLNLSQVDLRAATSIPEIVQAIREKAKDTAKGEWLRGWGYNDNKLIEKGHPNRRDLDDACSDHPVLIAHVSGHMCAVNSRALELSGITRTTPDPEGGVIEHEDSGDPIGILKETAQELVRMSPYTLAQMKEALAAANSWFLSEGITSAQDALAGTIATDEFRAYQDAAKEGLLKVRLILMPDIDRMPTTNGNFTLAWGLHSGFGNSQVKLGPVKIFIDGSLIGRTAALTKPYASDASIRGFLVKSEERLAEQVRMAHKGGWQVAMHAIGDRAIEVALNIFEGVMGEGTRWCRPRIEHCGVLRPDLIDRIRKLGVVVVTQPNFIRELGDGFRSALDEERLKLTYPLASLRGINVALSSDRPVVEGAPLQGIQAAVCRRTETGRDYVRDERISVDQAIRWYTEGSAYAAFEEQLKGTLEARKLADFIALSHDPFEVEPERLSEIKVELTVIGGEIVYER